MIYSWNSTCFALFLLFIKACFPFEKVTICQILIWNEQNASVFELGFWQRNKHYNKKKTTSWNLIKEKNVSVLEKYAFDKSRFNSFDSVKVLQISWFLNKASLQLKILQRGRFRNKKSTRCQFLNWFFYHKSNFELPSLQRARFWNLTSTESKILNLKKNHCVKFWIEKYTKCQILQHNNNNGSKFEIWISLKDQTSYQGVFECLM